MQFVSEERQQTFDKVLSQRTRHIKVVVEDIYQPQNASAVLRTCDCFGIQDVHIIENRNEYEVNPRVALGASKWLTLHRHRELSTDNTTPCIKSLKADGYTIVATTPHTNDVTIDQLPVDNKLAILYGNEGDGLSDVAMSMADRYVRIPMYGFTESFNISVAAALCLFDLRGRLNSSHVHWTLSEDEKHDLLLEWATKSIKNCEMIIADYHAKQST